MRLRRDETTDVGRAAPRFSTALAEDATTVLAAQRLRSHVFGTSGNGNDVDRDRFDAYCEHLIVRDTAADAVVGTYRILTAERASAAGGFYSETEFDLSRLRGLDARMVEVGRACVDPRYRSGAVIALLLAGLTRYLVSRGYDLVFGCASIDLGMGRAAAAALCREVLATHRAPDAWQVHPHVPFDSQDGPPDVGPPPPLIRAYLRLGAFVCGPPAFDAAFGTADLLMMLPIAAMNPRFRARVLRGDGGPARPRGGGTRWAA
jgi:putative hemolysin